MQRDKKISKILAVILCFAITLTNIQITTFADTQYKTTLDGWTVNAVWSDTRDYSYEWDATDTSSRQPKINISYKIEKAKKDYPIGSVSFTVPGIGNAAREHHPDLIPDRVSPHMFRHSKAMHLLQANVNIVYIRDLLGHESIKTTEVYARADNTLKRKALEKADPIKHKSLNFPDWNNDEDLMDWLRNLGK